MKTTITLYGSPLAEIRVGCAAYIHEAHRDRRTSVVLKIKKSSRYGIVFETLNTVYRLRFSRCFQNRNGGLHT